MKTPRALLAVYHGADRHAINEKIEALNQATTKLAENILNTTIRTL
jgi:hypothetical protein